MSRTLRRALFTVGIVGVATYFALDIWSYLDGEGVGLWPAAVVVGGLALVLTASVVFDLWLGRLVFDWVRGRRGSRAER